MDALRRLKRSALMAAIVFLSLAAGAHCASTLQNADMPECQAFPRSSSTRPS